MKKQLKPIIILSLFVVFSLACNLSTLSDATQPLPKGNIVYETDKYGNNELLTTNLQTKTTYRITNDTANQVAPTYIKATNKIGYASDQGEGWGLYTSDLNGENVKRIMGKKDIFVAEPNWSPDGKNIVASVAENCMADTSKCVYQLYTMKSDGSDQKKLFNGVGSYWGANWSPDGKQIAFAADGDGDSEIYVTNSDGSQLRQLTKNNDFDGWPRWSPDGKQIAFETSRDGGDWDLYVMNADGSDPKAITQNSSDDYGESWSPDGKWLVYISNVSGSAQIQIVGIDGKNEMKVTDDKSNHNYPCWIQ